MVIHKIALLAREHLILKMPACAVSTCNKRSSTSSREKDGITFHSFPKDPYLKKIWTTACARLPNWVPTRTSSICSRHFEASQFRTFPLPSKIRKLVDFAVPTTNLYESYEKNDVPIVPGSIDEPDPLGQVIKVEINCDVMLPNNKTLPSTSEEHLQPTNGISTLELIVSNRKLITKVKAQAKKNKRLQARTLYLERKVATLENLLKSKNIIVNNKTKNCKSAE